MKRLKSAIRDFVTRFDATDFPVLLRVIGFVFIGIGGNTLMQGAGYVACGILILFYGRPLLRWIK